MSLSKPPIVILVETMGPANLGSATRSLAAFGLQGLRLVTPRCKITEETKKWACYGKRIFDQIETYEDLPSALHDVDYAVALSRRDGKDRHRHYSLPALMNDVSPQFTSAGQIAVVFGNEESGLARHHLAACHCSAEIPTVAADGSLNLAHAVSVTLYELIGRPRADLHPSGPQNDHEEKAGPEKLAAFTKRCRDLLAQVGYPKHRNALDEEMVKLQSVILRSGLENWEVRLLLGMLSQVKYKLDNPS